MKRPRSIAGALIAAALLAAGCGDDAETAATTASTSTSAESAATIPAPEPGGVQGPGSGADGGDGPGDPSGAAQARRDENRAEREAEDAYAGYVEAIDSKDGEALCAMLPADAISLLKPPVERGGCAATLRASIGYRDPRGFPVWKSTDLTGFERTSVSADLTSARLTASVVTEFADRTEPSVENDIAYMERAGAESAWRLAKPSSVLYRAIGRPEPPPSVISPPTSTSPSADAASPSTLVSDPAGRVSGRPGLRDFRADVERISPKLRRRMTGVSWRRGCPVGLGDLRLISASYVDFHRRARQGRLVVNEDHAKGMVRVLRRMYAKRFPIRRMELIDRYEGDDHRSMRHDNTSAFNCRFVNGTTRWSMHAFGKAIDINPRENPYVSGSYVSPPEGRPYADRSDRRKGMLYRDGTVARAMKRIIGWEWGGDWTGARDYQHFSSNGS